MADTKPVRQDFEDDAKELASITSGTTFVYSYNSKQERELQNVPQMSIFGLEPKDWAHRLIGPIFEHESVTRYEIFSAPRNRQLGQGKMAQKKKEEESKKVDDKKEEVDAEGEKAGEVEMEKEEEEEVPPKKKIGHVRIWFKEGASDSQDVFLNLMKLKFKIPNRSILIKSQVLPSPTMSKQDLDTILDGFGAKESHRSINGRRLCFKDVPADLTEEVVRESLPDIEEMELRDDNEKAKCCIITLPTPDRAVIVMKEKRGTKAFGSTKLLRVNFMRNLDTETLAPLKTRNEFTKPDVKTRKRGAATVARPSTRGGYNGPDRKRKTYGGFSNGSMDNRSSAWGIRPAPFSSGVMARSVGGYGSGGILDDYRSGGGSFGDSMGGGSFSSRMDGGDGYGASLIGGGGASGYGAPPTLSGRSGGMSSMRSGMGAMNGMGSSGGSRSMMSGGGGGVGSGYGMGFTGSRRSAFNGSGGAW